MTPQHKKMIAPIVVSLLVILYYVAYFSLLIAVIDGVLKWLLGIIPLLLAGVMIHVCLQRIHEIRKGEEDDLSQY